MLKIVQILAMVQGPFLLFILFRNRARYKKVTFWLLFGSIVSVLLFLMGDDQNNLFLDGVDLFFFDSSLFITFWFLFFRYYKSGRNKFSPNDYLFFIPNLIYFGIEITELFSDDENIFIEVFELTVELTFLCYLLYIILYPVVNKTKSWVFYFSIPMALLLGMGYVNDILGLLGMDEIVVSTSDDFDSYLLLVIAFLFYFITFTLISSPAQILPKAKPHRYKTSNLNAALIEKCKNSLTEAMDEDKLFMDSKLSIHKVSQKIDIPRQYISEVLNLHMKTNFQDFVNGYRINEFLRRLETEKYTHYTLFGIASEVGFNSKSTFNTAFKKHTGYTPQAYRKELVRNKPLGSE